MNEWEWELLEARTPVESVGVAGVKVRKRSRVRLRPHERGDIFDVVLGGKTAIIESIEQDYDGKLHFAVVLEDDPGQDLGMMRQPGHRFFFTPDEVEPLPASKVLVAGIGNIFLGDDGFGVEVARRLASQKIPLNVTVRDFGIRSYDLAYAVLDDYDLVILVDATPRGGRPGTVYVIEPDLTDTSVPSVDPHTMNPVSVVNLARSMGEIKSRIILVGCEPADLGGEEGRMGLTVPVSAAVDEAVKVIEKLIYEGEK